MHHLLTNGPSGPRSRALLLCVLLAVLTSAAYSPVLRNGFVWDDGHYVVGNRQVTGGLTPANIRWAFTSTAFANWHPLTWISHQADAELFGLKPGGHHLTNLLWHTANALLLFLALRGLTGAAGRSALVAALFAVHPLHVESVAWIAERKDVLSAFFGILTLLAYLRYVRRPGRGRYLGVAACFAAGLMAKPMLVTLPFVLLLLDFWPLGRAPRRRGPAGSIPAWLSLAREKAPLFALTAISSVITFSAQRQGGAFRVLEQITPAARAANAAVSYLAYLGKMFWPENLAVFYPYPVSGIPPGTALGAGLALAALAAAAGALRRRQPAIYLGWFWFLGMLVPVIGLVQVGGQSMADRYTYLPLIGPFIALAWILHGLLPQRAGGAALAALAGGGLVVALALQTHRQTHHWRSEYDLYTAALAATSGNYMAHNNLALDLNRHGKPREAIAHLEQALRIKPSFAEARLNLGLALEQAGRGDAALEQFLLALRHNPDLPAAHVAAGLTLAGLGRPEAALAQFQEALRDDPGFSEAQLHLANFLEERGRFEEALTHYTEALRLDPENEIAHYDLGVTLEKRGRWPEAAARYRQALSLRPDFSDARQRLAIVLSRLGEEPLPGPSREARP